MNRIGLNSNRIVNFKAAQEMQMQQAPMSQEQTMTYEQQIPEIKIPDIYQSAIIKPEKSFKERLKKIDLMGLVYPWLEHPLMMLGTCIGLGWGVDKFSSACAGEYETSLVGKAARLGDNIENSKFVKSKPFQKVLDLGKSAKKKINHIFRNSDAIKAIKTTPSQPEWAFVKDELLNMAQRVTHDFNLVTNTLKLNGGDFVELKDLGLDHSDKKFIKDFFKGASVTEESVSNAVQLKRIGMADDAILDIIKKADATEIVKTKQLEKLGITRDFLKKLEGNPATSLRDIVKIREACKKGKGIRIGDGNRKWLGQFQIFERKIGLDEIGNRLRSMTEAKTKTGKALATFLQKCHRGFTFGGGKLGVLLFVSPLLVETMLDVKKAEPKQKVGTAVHGVVESCSWVFTFPIALSIMHHLGGVQYAGMTPDEVKECRKLISEFNEKANPYTSKNWRNFFGLGEKKAADKTFQTYNDYKKAKDILKGKLDKLRNKNVKDQNLLTKISKKLGKFLTMDLEGIACYKNGNFFGNTLRKIPNFFRNLGGVPLRVAIWSGLAMGVLGTAITKTINAIFGKHYDRFKEEEFTEAKKEQQKFLKEDLQVRLQKAQERKVYEAMKPQIAEDSVTPAIHQSPVTAEFLHEPFSDGNKKNLFAEPDTNDKLNKNESVVPEPILVTETADAKNIDNKVESNNNSENLSNKPSSSTVVENNNSSNQKNTIPEKKEINTSATPIAASETTKVSENIKPMQNTKTDLIDQYSYIPKSNPAELKTAKVEIRDNYTYIPSEKNVLNKENKNFQETKYIPSQAGANITKSFDNSGLEDALKRADRAEQKAIQTLMGNFNTY